MKIKLMSLMLIVIASSQGFAGTDLDAVFGDSMRYCSDDSNVNFSTGYAVIKNEVRNITKVSPAVNNNTMYRRRTDIPGSVPFESISKHFELGPYVKAELICERAVGGECEYYLEIFIPSRGTRYQFNCTPTRGNGD
jgi:hypothetical protein